MAAFVGVCVEAVGKAQSAVGGHQQTLARRHDDVALGRISHRQHVLGQRDAAHLQAGVRLVAQFQRSLVWQGPSADPEPRGQLPLQRLIREHQFVVRGFDGTAGEVQTPRCVGALDRHLAEASRAGLPVPGYVGLFVNDFAMPVRCPDREAEARGFYDRNSRRVLRA